MLCVSQGQEKVTLRKIKQWGNPQQLAEAKHGNAGTGTTLGTTTTERQSPEKKKKIPA